MNLLSMFSKKWGENHPSIHSLLPVYQLRAKVKAILEIVAKLHRSLRQVQHVVWR